MKKIHTLLSIDESKHEVALALIVLLILVVVIVVILYLVVALIDLDPQKEFTSYIHHPCLGLHTLIQQKLKHVMMYDVDRPKSYAIIQYVCI